MSSPVVTLREATMADMEKVFHWRNDAGIVALSGSQRPVSLSDHQAWFPYIIRSERHRLFVVVEPLAGEAGTVRIDMDGTDQSMATLTIYLMDGYRSRGIGTIAIEEGCDRAFLTWPTLLRIKATIRSDNEASVRAFTRAGFEIVAAPANAANGTLAVRTRPPR